MHNARMTLSEYLSEAGLTDAQFAEKLGVNRSTVTRIRNGTHPPSMRTVIRIAEATDGKVTANDLCGMAA